LAPRGSKRAVGRAELFAPVTRPYFLAPLDTEGPPFGSGGRLQFGVSSTAVDHAAGWLLGQGKTELTARPTAGSSLAFELFFNERVIYFCHTGWMASDHPPTLQDLTAAATLIFLWAQR
jgi:hypothetical protein